MAWGGERGAGGPGPGAGPGTALLGRATGSPGLCGAAAEGALCGSQGVLVADSAALQGRLFPARRPLCFGCSGKLPFILSPFFYAFFYAFFFPIEARALDPNQDFGKEPAEHSQGLADKARPRKLQSGGQGGRKAPEEWNSFCWEMTNICALGQGQLCCWALPERPSIKTQRQTPAGQRQKR